MADKKISALPAASTPLAGSEVLPIVQGGITEQVSVANLTAGRGVSGSSFTTTAGNFVAAENFGLSFGVGSTYVYGSTTNGFIRLDVNNATAFGVDSSRNATVSVGNLIIGTAGKGIDFSANSHAAGMTSELLNDYEEGNWTPVLHRETGGAITASYNTQTGKYVKVGNLVTVSGFVDVASVSAQGSGANEIKGLPYAPANNTLDAGSVSRNNAFTTDVVHSCFGWSDSRILFSSNVNSNAATAVDWKAGFVNFTFSYFV
jgi:hypothetical protein